MKDVKIAVVGSTGRTGRLVLNEGLRRGFAMTAFTRRPANLAGVPGLTAVVSGDARDLADVRRAVRGQDAVISIVSSKGLGPTPVLSDVTRADLAATLLDLAEGTNHAGEVLLVSEARSRGGSGHPSTERTDP